MSQKSILAGILIGIGNIGVMCCENRIVGALLFSLALLSIMHLNLPLFTGRIGKAYRRGGYPECFIILGFNIIGVSITVVGFICMNSKVHLDIFRNTSYATFDRSWMALFVAGFMCNVLIHIAMFARKDIITVLCTLTFFLCGFEHCVAASGYLMGAFIHTNGMALLKWLVIVAGNTAGATATEYLLHNIYWDCDT